MVFLFTVPVPSVYDQDGEEGAWELPDENEENVKWFTENYPFQTENLSPFLPECLKEEGKKGMLQLLPGIHETDGFFLARLRREE